MIPHRSGNSNFFLEQWERVKRWKNQCDLGLIQQDCATNLDFYEALFINSYHLKDWLAQWLTINKHNDILNSLRSDFKSKKFLKVLKDICNGSKHFTLNKEEVGKQYIVINEYVYGGGIRRVILIGGNKYPLNDLSNDVFDYWKSFLGENGLDKLQNELYPYTPFD